MTNKIKKYNVLLFFLIPLCSCSISYKPYPSKINSYNNKNERIGYWVEINDTTQLVSFIRYKAGKKHGKAIWYSPNGQPIKLGKFKNDTKIGKWLFMDKETGEIHTLQKYNCKGEFIKMERRDKKMF